MLVVFRIGRAGNQMFQFAASQAVRKHSEKVVYVGFDHLKAILPKATQSGLFLRFPRRLQAHFNKIDAILKLIASRKIIGGVFESASRDSLVRTSGILPITLFWGGWCQNEKLLDVDAIVRLFENDRSPIPASSPRDVPRRCFVHIRRGDYVTFPSTSSSAALPVEWFLEQMNTLFARDPNTTFSVFSDDVEFAKEHFSAIPQAKVFDVPASQAFAEMASSDDGIMSPSSFSWWAGRIAWERSRGTFIAPELWAGWNLGDWIPSRQVESRFISYQPVIKP